MKLMILQVIPGIVTTIVVINFQSRNYTHALCKILGRLYHVIILNNLQLSVFIIVFRELEKNIDKEEHK